MAKGKLAQAHQLLGIAEALSKTSHFNLEECRLLIIFHQRLVACNGNLDRLRFRELLHFTFNITDDIMLDLINRAFDRDSNGMVDETEWVQGLSSMIRGTLEELIEFVYFVYDINGDRSLAREELYFCLKGCIHPGYGIELDEIEDCERDIVEITMKKLDIDKDGQITFPDFQNAVSQDPLMLQACGPCLPATKSLAAFLALITMRYRSYTGVWSLNWAEGEKTKKVNKLARKASLRKGSKGSLASTTISIRNKI